MTPVDARSLQSITDDLKCIARVRLECFAQDGVLAMAGGFPIDGMRLCQFDATPMSVKRKVTVLVGGEDIMASSVKSFGDDTIAFACAR